MNLSPPESEFVLSPGDALLLVDVQNDFLPGGQLAVPGGDEVVPVLNGYLARFQEKNLPVFATRDWHPARHCSFKEQGGTWPVHCVAETAGARYPSNLHLPSSTVIISKATQPDQDAYSGFEGTDLNARLKAAGIRRLFIGGLATDYCVLNTVKDALQHGYQVFLLEDGIRAVNLKPDDGARAIEEMIRGGSRLCTLNVLDPHPPGPGALLTDLYQLTMLQAYFDRDMKETAVFEFFIRRLPRERGFLVAAGLKQCLEYLETLRFTSEELAWLRACGRFSDEFIDSLTTFRFAGDVDAMPEGTVFFADEPILRVSAPLPQAQLIETRIINLLQFQTLVASKAARMVLAGPGKTLIDFGLRRAHGAEAGRLAARASYLAGFAGTATVQAGMQFGIPVFGTMAHSFIQAHAVEEEAFQNFARSQPDNVVLLLDTYDTSRATRKVVALAQQLNKEGIRIRGVRLDSGDLAAHARHVREILDQGGLEGVKIFVSGNLDEFAVHDLVSRKVPVDGFGIGTRMTTSADVPYLDSVYKLQEYAGQPRRKRSEDKATWPGRKQVYRFLEENGKMKGDLIALEKDQPGGTPLLQPVMRAGRRVRPHESLDTIRRRVAEELDRLPDPLRSLKETPPYPVEVSRSLRDLARTLDKLN